MPDVIGIHRTLPEDQNGSIGNKTIPAAMVIKMIECIDEQDRKLAPMNDFSIKNIDSESITLSSDSQKDTDEVSVQARDMIIWKSAIALANNVCVQMSDRYSNDDRVYEARVAAECANEVKKLISLSADQLGDILKEVDAPDGAPSKSTAIYRELCPFFYES